MEVLAAIAAATARLLEPAALYDVLQEQVGRLVECDSFYLALWDAEVGRMRFVAHTDRGARLPPSEAPLGERPDQLGGARAAHAGARPGGRMRAWCEAIASAPSEPSRPPSTPRCSWAIA